MFIVDRVPYYCLFGDRNIRTFAIRDPAGALLFGVINLSARYYIIVLYANRET